MSARDDACSAWPPADCCKRCHGDGGWYSRLGPTDWDWSSCWDCRGTGEVVIVPAVTPVVHDPCEEPKFNPREHDVCDECGTDFAAAL